MVLKQGHLASLRAFLGFQGEMQMGGLLLNTDMDIILYGNNFRLEELRLAR